MRGGEGGVVTASTTRKKVRFALLRVGRVCAAIGKGLRGEG